MQGNILKLRRASLSALGFHGQIALARPHPEHEDHIGIVYTNGTMQEVQLGYTGGDSIVLAEYELLLTAEEGTLLHPVHKPWSDFVFHEGGIVFSQRSSPKILFSQLPLLDEAEGGDSGVFLFGSHIGDITCMAKAGPLLVSGASDGSIKMWHLDDGSMLDLKAETETSRITSVQFVGPLMVAAGTSVGSVTMFDISTNLLKAVQRFQVDIGPVDSMTSALQIDLSTRVALAQGPRPWDGGGTVSAPMGLPWRAGPGSTEDGATSTSMRRALHGSTKEGVTSLRRAVLKKGWSHLGGWSGAGQGQGGAEVTSHFI